MGRILAIDFGTKRVGLASTDPLQIIASPLDTVPNKEILTYLKSYLSKEGVDKIIVGMPKNLQNEDTHSTESVRKFVLKLEKTFPEVKVITADERFTSKMAFQTMIDGGLKKKDRQNKETVDKVSATIILQSYLQSNSSY
ncbi:Holliday junction resolvase RuvX [Fulvivirga lutimaris]|uniref:Holliday junction resolvase RuvX n=1 Tax=Fulvivirga lutimaris TaxID=1819566 RepID=UPI0016277E3E|nr:Holliday junction resolvase RuvX [Fulvivirga lutimaris]